MFEKKKADKRTLGRKPFSYYMQVVDDNEEKPIGYLTDISPHGFRLDCKQAVAINHTYSLRVDLTGDVANKASMVLVARNRWCRPDVIDPFIYNAGFQIVSMEPEDVEILQRIVAKYGA